MNHVEGKTLTKTIKDNEGRLGTEHVVTLMLPLIEQLEALHERKFIHRDNKADSIILMQDHSREHLVFVGFWRSKIFCFWEQQ